MRVLVISDIHGNLIALQTVMKHAGKVNAVWCLGDVVGYGPNPNECIELLKEQPNLTCLLGNHDAAAIGDLSMITFNREARQALEWTQDELKDEHKGFLSELPQVAIIDQVTLAHGSPRQPLFEYILDSRTAIENFDYFETEYCFIGHSHIPLVFSMQTDEDDCVLSLPTANQSTKLIPRAIINPGSVGQPRDHDPRAAYAIYDTDAHSWDFRRVNYDINTTQELMRSQNLPERHITRLTTGW